MVLFAKYPKVSDYDLSSVKRIVCAAAPLSAEIEDTVMKRLKLEEIQQGNHWNLKYKYKLFKKLFIFQHLTKVGCCLLTRLAPVIFCGKTDNLSKIAVYKLHLE